ncbi:aspartate/glutamate racemase family protein [Lactobacillus helveticus]|uniref:aspartate/glutamate racemase family protein n=1 Tax=Lactobacillus helveticus TaxID=1587 RepID=UPI0030D4E762
MKNFFTVLGGMSTLATQGYINLVNHRVKIKDDQDYMNYILVNHATIPDRTTWIEDHFKPNPYDYLKEDVLQQAPLKPDFFLMSCNTAHYWYDELAALSDVPFLNMMEIAVHKFVDDYPDEKNLGLIATEGSIRDGLYVKYIKKVNKTPVLGGPEIQLMVNQLIYGDIKEKGKVDPELFHHILTLMHDKYGCKVVLLGCTELSLANEKAPDPDVAVIDPQSIIADVSIELEEKIRNGMDPKEAVKKYMYD